MIHKLRLSELRQVVKNLILEAEEGEDDRRGPVDKMKGWQPPSNMVRGTDTTDWTQWDRDDMAGDEFIVDDSGDLDESDGAEGDEE